MRKTRNQKLLRIEILVDDRIATAHYQYEGLPPTNMQHDEDVSTWTDHEITRVFANLLDLSDREIKLVQVQHV